jgi:NAD(P)-dependent dehydrogenase (short-subunit alcohol dehydrogenase family)
MFGRLDALAYWIDYGFRTQQFMSDCSSDKSRAADIGLSGIDRYVELHALGLLLASAAALETFRKNKTQPATTYKIIALSTTLGFMGSPGYASYSASRAAAEALLESIGYEAQHLQVRTVTLDIGFPPVSCPRELAAHVLRLLTNPEPPLRVVLGRTAANAVQDKLRSTMEEIEDWKFIFPEDED